MKHISAKSSERIFISEDKSLEISSWNGGLTVQKKIFDAIFQYESPFDKLEDITPENHQKRVIEELFLSVLSKPLSHILSSKSPSEQENFLEEIVKIMQQKTEEGALLQRNKKYLETHSKNFQVIIDARNNILGFFEFKFIKEHRKLDKINFVEMGAVFSCRECEGIGSELIKIFEIKRKKLGVPNGCAITKDKETAEFFINQTGGKITEFPDWFKRNTDDRFFISWTNGYR